MSIEKIILTLDKKFEKDEVYFDLSTWLRGDGVMMYKVWVSDFDFYMNNKRFKNIIKVLRKKYNNVRFFCYYRLTPETDE